ncbi:O-antigen ligase family protein [uncultured Flavobacterium sp.]|uniref:O-antigen ligase family protein n=1 Tax=uncultured Flavobacterium sp. TaxID=165435 RepID=UPI0030EB5C37|tara:strand:- start:33580 stop:34758 length:1179 start_codon:yes stop_codon:yes gene_type:complete
MKINLNKYLLYSSVFAIFTEAFFFNFIIDWKLLYLIIFANFILLLKYKKITFNIYFVALLAFFFIHGVITYTVIKIPYNFMLSQILGIAVVGTYYYNFVKLYKPIEIINVYCKMAFWIALIGYPMFFLGINFGQVGDTRLYSIFKEPAHYVIVVLPACYYFFKEKKYLSFLVVFGTLILSSSSLGYVGCGLLFLLPNLTLKRVKYFLAITPLLVITFIYVYNNFEFFKMRVEETYSSLNVANTGKFDEYTNLSTYVLISNVYIAKKNIIDHPLGSGIGSHHYMHTQHYLKEMRPPPYLVSQKKQTDNSFDANSLFTRICSEFGLIGFIGIILGLIYLTKSYNHKELYFAQGIAIYFLLKLFRDGTYFPPELFFFIWIFYFSYKDFFAKKLTQ